MSSIHAKLITDHHTHPVAVQIEYSQWLKIKQLLQNVTDEKEGLLKYAGSIHLKDLDPLDYQKNMRDEWQP